MIKNYLLMQNIKVENANAFNNITVGMPAVTGFLGAVHALERRLGNVKFGGTSIIVHEYSLRVHKDLSRKLYLSISSPSQIKHNKFAENEHIINQAYIDLDISLVVEIDKINEDVSFKVFRNTIIRLLNTMRIAGGNIVTVGNVKVIDDLNNIPYGYALVSDEVDLHTNDEDALEYSIRRMIDDSNLILIPTGFKGITDFCNVEGVRDNTVMHRFAESIYRLCRFINTKSDNTDLRKIFWKYEYNDEDGLYQCVN